VGHAPRSAAPPRLPRTISDGSSDFESNNYWRSALTLRGVSSVRDVYAFGSRSNIEDNEAFKALQISKRRPALTRFFPLSYF
jgi:hypothetical protein